MPESFDAVQKCMTQATLREGPDELAMTGVARLDGLFRAARDSRWLLTQVQRQNLWVLTIREEFTKTHRQSAGLALVEVSTTEDTKTRCLRVPGEKTAGHPESQLLSPDFGSFENSHKILLLVISFHYSTTYSILLCPALQSRPVYHQNKWASLYSQ